MKLKEAIEMHERSTEPLGKDHKYPGLKLGKVLITPEMLESTGWGYCYENNDPEFAKTINGLIEVLKEEGPLISEKPGLHVVR